MSAAKPPSVRLAQLSQISRPPSTRVFCHTAFPLGFLRCKQAEMFSICGCFRPIRAAKTGKKAWEWQSTAQRWNHACILSAFCSQLSLDPNPHSCLSQFATAIVCYYTQSLIVFTSRQGARCTFAGRSNKDPTLTPGHPEWTSDVRR